MEIKFVDLKVQYNSIRQEIDSRMAEVLENTDFINGKAVKEFEQGFAAFCGTQFAVACANGTDAIEIALKAYDIKAGDEVIVPAMSFIATSEAVTNVGGKVVFCDIDPDSYNIDPVKIKEKISEKTRFIVVVHIYGQICDMEQICAIAKEFNLIVIEDCAQSHGAKLKGKQAGQWGDCATFSFYPGKNLGAYGDGGAIVTNDAAIAKKSKMIANHGRVEKYDHEFEGRNSRMDTLQAAILNAKLPYLKIWNQKRQENAKIYNRFLSKISALQIPSEIEGSEAVYHLYVIKVSEEKRDILIEHLKKNQIASGIHYPIALPFLKAYQYLQSKIEDFPVSYQHTKEIVSLPMYPELSEEQIQYVCQTISEFFEKS